MTTTTHYTAAELIAHAKSYIAADAAIMSKRPAAMPRAAWRMSNNPTYLPIAFTVRDTAFATQPTRRLAFDLNGNPYDLWVWSTGARPKLIETIDLRAADADKKLARYVRAGSPVIAQGGR